MGILSGSGVKLSSLHSNNKGESFGVIHKGKPTHKKFFVYTFEAKYFKNIPKGDHQYICFQKIKPLKKESFNVEEYAKFIKYKRENLKGGKSIAGI